MRARVSLATLYHYFPSKVHVLVWALDRELLRFDDFLSEDLAGVTEAIAHAYVASNLVASAEAEMIRVEISAMFARLMGGDEVTNLHRRTADILTDVWTAELLAVVQSRRSHADVRERLTTVINLIARRTVGQRLSPGQ
ncbi:hypothetical protein A5778_17605 [Mycolicibacterium monacense]|nr:hypothetical protein A5778_17605 [Mycolicibacterium monacense]